MPKNKPVLASSHYLQILVFISGLATLSWELVWQIKASLALGVSAWGTAVTLAVLMGGMSLGAFVGAGILAKVPIKKPTNIYGVLEIVIGLAGLLLAPLFAQIERLDTWAYSAVPGNGVIVYIAGITAVLAVPSICMGATVPVFGLLARQFQTSIAVLYGLNTLGGTAGCILAAFFIIPVFGVTGGSWAIALLNICVGVAAFLLPPGRQVTFAHSAEKSKNKHALGSSIAMLAVAVTGYVTFALEVTWFRWLTAAFKSTSPAFAMMLASVLLSLGLAARYVHFFKKLSVSVGILISISGVVVLLATPLIERFDLIALREAPFVLLYLNWSIMTFLVIGLPIFFLGLVFPWVIEDQDSVEKLSRLYALNTLAAITGSLTAAWLLLPAIGSARTSWLCGAVLVIVGSFMAPRRMQIACGIAGIAAIIFAVVFESGAGRTRVQGQVTYFADKGNRILEFFEGPEATVSAFEYANGDRDLIIDGFSTAAQTRMAHYMPWMGHLPMLLHPDPENALVICFGTGQTSNAVREEGPQSLDIVDINPRVFRLAHNFPANNNVLGDARVHPIVMDGRSYMRRTDKMYDVITLEPMPPNFVGVNALYSREFYQLAQQRLSENGVVAQWLPFHLVTAYYMASIVATFQSVFPNAILWIDPVSETGIIIGTKNNKEQLGTSWPGFARTNIQRDMSEVEVKEAVLLDPEAIKRYAARADIITDDNQLLAYGRSVQMYHSSSIKDRKHFEWMGVIGRN